MAVVDPVWGRLTRSIRLLANQRVRRRSKFIVAIAALRWIVVASVIMAIGWGAAWEMRTSYFPSALFTRLAAGLMFAVEDGRSEAIRFPKSGPYDERLGYIALPEIINSLTARGFAVDSQARWTSDLARFVSAGTFPVYREKDRAGLRIYDRGGEKLHRVEFQSANYRGFASIPDLVVNTPLFVEDRDLLDLDYPERIRPSNQPLRSAAASRVAVRGSRPQCRRRQNAGYADRDSGIRRAVSTVGSAKNSRKS